MTTTFDWPTTAREPIATAQPCAHHLWDDPTSYPCTQVGDHDTHTYTSRDVADGHDDSEAKACA